jgi:tryptophan 6-halogenase
LYDKIGNGYVYSSQYIDYESAKAELLQEIGLPPETVCNSVKMKIGRHTDAWKNNILGIG